MGANLRHHHILLGGATEWQRKSQVLSMPDRGGKGDSAPPVGPALGQHGVNIMGFCKEFNERTAKQAGLIISVVITVSGSFLHVYHQDPARSRPDQEGLRHRIRLRPEPRQGREDHQGPVARDRHHQDARPERRKRRSRDEHGRGHRPFHGRCGCRLTKLRLTGVSISGRKELSCR